MISALLPEHFELAELIAIVLIRKRLHVGPSINLMFFANAIERDSAASRLLEHYFCNFPAASPKAGLNDELLVPVIHAALLPVIEV
jgi:hypothetical protein